MAMGTMFRKQWEKCYSLLGERRICWLVSLVKVALEYFQYSKLSDKWVEEEGVYAVKMAHKTRQDKRKQH